MTDGNTQRKTHTLQRQPTHSDTVAANLQGCLVNKNCLAQAVGPKQLDVAPNDGCSHRCTDHCNVTEIQGSQQVTQVCSQAGDVIAKRWLVAVAMKAKVHDVDRKAFGKVLCCRRW